MRVKAKTHRLRRRLRPETGPSWRRASRRRCKTRWASLGSRLELRREEGDGQPGPDKARGHGKRTTSAPVLRAVRGVEGQL